MIHPIYYPILESDQYEMDSDQYQMHQRKEQESQRRQLWNKFTIKDVFSLFAQLEFGYSLTYVCVQFSILSFF